MNDLEITTIDMDGDRLTVGWDGKFGPVELELTRLETEEGGVEWLAGPLDADMGREFVAIVMKAVARKVGLAE